MAATVSNAIYLRAIKDFDQIEVVKNVLGEWAPAVRHSTTSEGRPVYYTRVVVVLPKAVESIGSPGTQTATRTTRLESKLLLTTYIAPSVSSDHAEVAAFVKALWDVLHARLTAAMGREVSIGRELFDEPTPRTDSYLPMSIRVNAPRVRVFELPVWNSGGRPPTSGVPVNVVKNGKPAAVPLVSKLDVARALQPARSVRLSFELKPFYNPRSVLTPDAPTYAVNASLAVIYVSDDQLASVAPAAAAPAVAYVPPPEDYTF